MCEKAILTDGKRSSLCLKFKHNIPNSLSMALSHYFIYYEMSFTTNWILLILFCSWTVSRLDWCNVHGYCQVRSQLTEEILQETYVALKRC